MSNNEPKDENLPKPLFEIGEYVVVPYKYDAFEVIATITEVLLKDGKFQYLHSKTDITTEALPEMYLRKFEPEEFIGQKVAFVPLNEDFITNNYGSVVSFDEKEKKSIVSIENIDKINDIIKLEVDYENLMFSNKAIYSLPILKFPVKNYELKELNLNNHFFFHNFTWRLDKRLNIISGKNGYGKTIILRMLVACANNLSHLAPNLMLKTIHELFNPTDNWFKISLELYAPNIKIFCMPTSPFPALVRRNFITEKGYKMAMMSHLPLVAIPAFRFINKDLESVGQGETANNLIEQCTTDFLFEKPTTRVFDSILSEIVTGDDKSKDELLAMPIIRLFQKIFDKLRLPFHFHSVQTSPENTFRKILYVETEQKNIKIPIQKASTGIISILTIVSFIYKGLESYYYSLDVSQKPEKIEEAYGTVIIDELDAHLHPTLERNLLRVLLEVFPNVQFIVASHSPLLELDAENGQVVRLDYNPNTGKHTLEVKQHSFQGLSYRDIYRDIFDLEEEFGWEALKVYRDYYLNQENFKKMQEIIEKGNSTDVNYKPDSPEYIEYNDYVKRLIIIRRMLENLPKHSLQMV